jgi:bacterioferritin-associated ferredoxin
MGDYSTVGIWTHCPTCADEAVAVVQFANRDNVKAHLVDFRCPGACRANARAVLRGLRLTTLDRAS